MTNKDVVMKLIGAVNPVGETHTDDARFENLKELCGLIDEPAYEVRPLITRKHTCEYSIRRAGEYAEKYIADTFKP